MSNYGGEDIVPWVAPGDIAAAIAKEIVTPSAENKVIYVSSEELSCTEVARTLGEAIGKPELKWMLISNEQMLNALKGFGMPEGIATDFVEMNASMHRGDLFDDYYNNLPKEMGQIKLKDFAKEFAGAFNEKTTK